MSMTFLASAARGFSAVISSGAIGVMVDVGTAIGQSVWESWARKTDAAKRRKELESLVACSQEQLREEIQQAVAEALSEEPTEVQDQAAAYLAGIPAQVRRSFRRPPDPPARHCLPHRSHRRCLPLHPPQAPRFAAGDRPLPVVDFEAVGAGRFGRCF